MIFPGAAVEAAGGTADVSSSEAGAKGSGAAAAASSGLGYSSDRSTRSPRHTRFNESPTYRFCISSARISGSASNRRISLAHEGALWGY
jgi:hypothetical protein